ncbi:MAG: xanthine/uracil/vitamin C permease [Defluviitaleaceae bacterium]|nr:xanthine/uracil/vitamin C permease [Defluviitaleaceae bacterium]
MKNLFFSFKSGDVGGIAYAVVNNIVNYIIVITTLTALGWPNEIIFFRVVPGMTMGLVVGGFYYAYMACKLAKKEGRTDVTALPSGVHTPAMFVFLFGVITPLHFALGDPLLAWQAAVAACFIGGLVEISGSVIGPWLKNNLPRAAMLGAVAGIGFIWMATQGLFDVYGDPVLGMPILLLSVMGLFGGYLFPKKIPPFAVAIVGGIIYAMFLGQVTPDFSGIGPTFPNPFVTIPAIIDGMQHVAPFLPVVIPVMIFSFIGTMNNVESAEAAGDKYNVREAQIADGACTMITALFGGCIPNTIWIGHPGLKSGNAGVSYSWISSIALGAAGFFGLFMLLHSVVPMAVAAVTFLWCAVVIVSQGYKEVKVKHYAALVIAMIPAVADFLYTQVTGVMGLAGTWASTQADGLPGYSAEITQNLINAGVMWNGVPAIRSGSILVGLMWGAATVFIIDKQLFKAGIVFIVGVILSMTGFIHSAALTFNITSPFAIGYLIMAVMCFVLMLGKGKWFDAPDDFEYV